MLKRMTVLTISLLLITGLLSSCGAKPQESPTASPASTPETPAAVTPEEVYTYYIVQQMTQPVTSETPMVKHWEEVFGCKFKIDMVEQSQIQEQMALRFAGNDIPDVITNLGYAKFYDLVNEGIAGTWPEEFLRTHAPKVGEYIDELGPDAWEISKHANGEMFCTPGVNPNYMYGMAIIWNDGWLSAVGEEIPKTLEDAERTWYKFANDDPNGNGTKDTYGLSKEGMNQVYGAYGVPLNFWIEDKDGQIVYANVAPAMKDALATLARYYADGVLDPEFITGENKGDYWALSHAFDQARIGFTCMGVYGHWDSMNYLTLPGAEPRNNMKLFLELNPGNSYSYGWPLEGPNGDKYTGINAYAFWSIYGKSMTEDLGKFAKWWEIFEVLGGFRDTYDYLTMAYGIEGEHWDFNDIGVPVTKEGIDKNSLGLGAAFTFSNNHHGVLASNKLLEALRQEIYVSDPSRYAMWPNPVPIPLPSETDYKAECQKIVDEGFVAIITGEKPINHFDEIVKKWYDAGGTILTEEANAKR